MFLVGNMFPGFAPFFYSGISVYLPRPGMGTGMAYGGTTGVREGWGP